MENYEQWRAIKRKLFLFYCLFFLFLFSPEIYSYDYFYYLKFQMNLGPRYPGSEGYKKFRKFIEHNYSPIIDSFTVDLSKTLFKTEKKINGYNYILRFNKGKKRKIFISAHYDTRLYADRDKNNPYFPVPGANDGASGVAIILGLIDNLNFNKINAQIDFILFDFEDQGFYGDSKTFCIGSQSYAAKLNFSYDLGINIDMVADKDLNIYMERKSYTLAPIHNKKFFDLAQKLWPNNFFSEVYYEIYDDHVPFLEKGIPVIEIIDFDYKYWHTTQDDIFHIDPNSLNKVGEVIEKFLYTFY